MKNHHTLYNGGGGGGGGRHCQMIHKWSYYFDTVIQWRGGIGVGFGWGHLDLTYAPEDASLALGRRTLQHSEGEGLGLDLAWGIWTWPTLLKMPLWHWAGEHYILIWSCLTVEPLMKDVPDERPPPLLSPFFSLAFPFMFPGKWTLHKGPALS